VFKCAWLFQTFGYLQQQQQQQQLIQGNTATRRWVQWVSNTILFLPGVSLGV